MSNVRAGSTFNFIFRTMRRSTRGYARSRVSTRKNIWRPGHTELPRSDGFPAPRGSVIVDCLHRVHAKEESEKSSRATCEDRWVRPWHNGFRCIICHSSQLHDNWPRLFFFAWIHDVYIQATPTPTPTPEVVETEVITTVTREVRRVIKSSPNAPRQVVSEDVSEKKVVEETRQFTRKSSATELRSAFMRRSSDANMSSAGRTRTGSRSTTEVSPYRVKSGGLEAQENSEVCLAMAVGLVVLCNHSRSRQVTGTALHLNCKIGVHTSPEIHCHIRAILKYSWRHFQCFDLVFTLLWRGVTGEQVPLIICVLMRCKLLSTSSVPSLCHVLAECGH